MFQPRSRLPHGRSRTLLLGLSLTLGCGYGSVYPEPTLRNGGPLLPDTADPAVADGAEALPCSPAPGGPIVDVLIVNSVPLDVFIKDSACVEQPFAHLPAAYTEQRGALDLGSSLVVRDLSGGFLVGATVPDTGGATWQVTLP